MMFSKTEELCTCGALQRAAEDAWTPVEFNEDIGAFFLTHGRSGKSKKILRHCFFCGGKSPVALREHRFAPLTIKERFRLVALTSPLKTVAQTLEALGPPDQDRAMGSMTTFTAHDDQTEVTRTYRVLRYQNLSETMDIQVTVYPPDQVSFEFYGKRLAQEADPPTGQEMPCPPAGEDALSGP